MPLIRRPHLSGDSCCKIQEFHGDTFLSRMLIVPLMNPDTILVLPLSLLGAFGISHDCIRLTRFPIEPPNESGRRRTVGEVARMVLSVLTHLLGLALAFHAERNAGKEARAALLPLRSRSEVIGHNGRITRGTTRAALGDSAT